MDVFEIFNLVIELAPEGLVVLGLIASYIILVYAVISFLEEGGGLRTRLYQVDTELQALRGQFPHRRRLIARLKKEIVPLRKDFRQLCDYYAELRDIEIAAERESMENVEPEHDIAVRENLDVLPARPQWSFSMGYLSGGSEASTEVFEDLN